MRRLGTFFALCAAYAFLSSASFFLNAESSILDGEEIWRIILTPSSGVFRDLENFRNYENESNVQRILEAGPRRVVIERRVNYAPFKPDVALSEADAYARDPDLEPFLERPRSRLILSRAETLAQGLSTQVEYVDAVMFEVRERLTWKSSSVVEAEAVYKLGYGVCAAFANLAVALLRAEGIPCRVAHVLTLRHPSWNAGAHAEVEVYYEGHGWVSYDPQMYEHFGPFPRIYYGFGTDSTIWSDDEELWKAASYFWNLAYNVQYVQVKNEVRLVGMKAAPPTHDFVTREDGVGNNVATISGTVYDGNGKPSKDEWIYYTLDNKGNSYDGAPLTAGSYAIELDKDGGRLYSDKKGYIVFYDFPGYSSAQTIVHDIHFDESDSIVVDTGRANATVKWYFKENSYYSFNADSKGILRLHVNPGPGSYRVDASTYVYSGGAWRKKP
jgi:hypothetical protein